MPRIFSEREKIILYLTIGVITFGIGYSYLIRPVIEKNAALSKKILQTKTKLNKYRRLLSQKQSLQDKYNKLNFSFKLSDQGEGTVVGVLSELENLAKEADIYFDDIRPQTTREADSQKEIIIDLKTEGSIEGYLRFIYSIEHSPMLLKIKKFQLGARPNRQVLEGSFSISCPSI